MEEALPATPTVLLRRSREPLEEDALPANMAVWLLYCLEPLALGAEVGVGVGTGVGNAVYGLPATTAALLRGSRGPLEEYALAANVDVCRDSRELSEEDSLVANMANGPQCSLEPSEVGGAEFVLPVPWPRYSLEPFGVGGAEFALPAGTGAEGILGQGRSSGELLGR